jgi:RNA polymerase sigma factor (TIGR02999 family)
MADVSALLTRWQEQGDKSALDEMLPLVYDELRRLARFHLGRERPEHTLQPTELVHEAYMRLTAQHTMDWKNRAHFFAVAACMMRRVLLHHARDRSSLKRQAYSRRVPLDFALERIEEAADVDIEALDAAMERLAALDPRMAKTVELRVFGGLTIEESAEVLALSAATVKRDWVAARLWLRKELA